MNFYAKCLNCEAKQKFNTEDFYRIYKLFPLKYGLFKFYYKNFKHVLCKECDYHADIFVVGRKDIVKLVAVLV